MGTDCSARRKPALFLENRNESSMTLSQPTPRLFRTLALCTLGAWLALPGIGLPLAQGDDTDAGFSTRLYIAHADGSNPKPLFDSTEFTSQGSPCWSRDGKLVCFDGCRKGEIGSQSSILVVNADGTNLRVLTDGAMPSFSPQARRMAFSRYSLGRGIWIMSTDGPDVELIHIEEAGWGTDWSPDGTRVAFTQYQQGGANICVFNLVEGTRTFLFAAGESPYRQIYWNFAWSPDSRHIAFKGARKDGKPELAVVSADGASQGLKTVVEEDALPALSYFPDGRLMYNLPVKERGNRMQLFTLDPRKDDAPQMLPKLAPEFAYQDACTSPDGEYVIYVRRTPKPAAKPAR